MKILYFAPMHVIHSRRWIKYFADKGHEVHVICPVFNGLPDRNDYSGLDNVIFHKLKLDKSAMSLKYIFQRLALKRRLKKLIHAIAPDVIHVHWVNVWTYLIAKMNVHPFIITAWGSDILIEPRKNILFKLIAKGALRGADAITCDAEHMKRAICSFGVDPDRVKVIYFGTDLTLFNPLKKDSTIRKALGFEGDAKIIISLRSLNPIYDIQTFIMAMPHILKKVREARFVVVGSGSEETKLVRLSQELGVYDKVRFVGRLSDEALQRFTASADIYVSTSLSDGGLAASTAEAMACRIPVVITNFGNNSDWIKDYENGLLFQMKDFRGLAERVVYLAQNPAKASEMARKGLAVIEGRNNWHREMEKMEDIYRESSKGKSSLT